MTNDTIYGVTDTHLNSKAKYCELRFITTWKSGFPKTMYKYIDSGKPYRYTYYFSTEDKAREFENYLFNKYEKEKQENQEYLLRKPRKAKEIIENWLGGIVAEDDIAILYHDILNAEDKDFSELITIVNDFLGYQNNDGEFDGLAMELSELYED